MRCLVAVLLLIGFASQACATIQLCNKFQHPIHFALAYETSDGWTSEGWIDVAPDECVVDKKHAELTSFYFRAESDPFDTGQGKKVTRFWGKGRNFSVKDGPFTFQQADRQQPSARLATFVAEPVTLKSPSATATLELSDKGITTIITQAKADPSSDPDYVTCEQSSGEEAKAACDRAIASGKYSGEALSGLYLDRGVEQEDLKARLADYDQALKINPRNATALNNRGATYNKLQEYDRATEDLDQAIKLEPDSAIAYRNRGDAYRGKGDREHAINDYQKALSLNPKESLKRQIQEQLDKLSAEEGKTDSLGSDATAPEARTTRLDAFGSPVESPETPSAGGQAPAPEPQPASTPGPQPSARPEPQGATTQPAASNSQPQEIAPKSGAGSAGGQTHDEDFNTCKQDSGEPVLEACNRAIASGKWSGGDLAWLYNVRGSYHRTKNELDSAVDDYDQAIKFAPDYAAAFGNRCNVYGMLKQIERAIADCDQAIKLDPGQALFWTNRGLAYADKGGRDQSAADYDRAITDFNKAISLGAKYAAAYWARGGAYLMKGDADRAIQDLTQAIQLAPEAAYPYERRALAYLQKGLYETAIRDFDDAVRINPQDAVAYKYRATAYLQLKNYERAIQDFGAAIAIDPNYAEAYADRALAYENLVDEDAALDDFNAAVRLDPTDALTYKNRAFLHWKRHELDRASVDLIVALSLMPNDSLRSSIKASRAQLGNVRINPEPLYKFSHRALSSQDFKACQKSSGEQAIAACTVAIDSGKFKGVDLTALYGNRGLHRRNGGDFGGALADYDEALALDPSSAVALNNRSNVYLKKKEYDKAIEDADQAIRLYPNYRNAFLNRGVAFAEKGEYNRAIESFNQAIGIDPQFSTAFMSRGTAFLQKGDRERAKFDFMVALARSSDEDQKREIQTVLDSLNTASGSPPSGGSSSPLDFNPPSETRASSSSSSKQSGASSPRVDFNPAAILPPD